MTDVEGPRRYRSQRRAQQAAQTRADVIAAATELFAERGWAGTTMAAVARSAGVAVDTVYAGFGSKAALLAAAKDVALFGDTDPTPALERPELAGLEQGPRAERLRVAARLSAAANARMSPLDAAWREAAAGDETLAASLQEREALRYTQTATGFERLLGHRLDRDVMDAVWLLMSSEAYAKLTAQRNRTTADYEDWLTGVLDRLTR